MSDPTRFSWQPGEIEIEHIDADIAPIATLQPTIAELAERAEIVEGPIPTSAAPPSHGTIYAAGSGAFAETPLQKNGAGATVSDDADEPRGDEWSDAAREAAIAARQAEAKGKTEPEKKGKPEPKAPKKPAKKSPHDKAASDAAADAEGHAAALRRVADAHPEHEAKAAEAEGHAGAAREAADRAKDAKTPGAKAAHAGAAMAHAARAEHGFKKFKNNIKAEIKKHSEAKPEAKEPKEGGGKKHPWLALLSLLLGKKSE